MLNQLRNNFIYMFYFTEPFSKLNKAYKVLGSLSFDNLITIKVDLKKNLYAPVGAPDTLYQKDLPKLKKATFYKLTPLTNKPQKPVYYIPDIYFAKEPVFNLLKCKQLTITIPIGIWKDKTTPNIILTELKDLLQDRYGILTEPQIFVTDEMFLTTAKYNAMDAYRQNLKTVTKTYISEIDDYEQEITRLKNQIAALEEIITNP